VRKKRTRKEKRKSKGRKRKERKRYGKFYKLENFRKIKDNL
jgi:hypothetical protein